MAPFRRRTRALLVVAGLLLVAVVGLAWFLVGDDDPTGADAAGAPTTLDPAAGPAEPEPTTAPGPTTVEDTSPAGDGAAGALGAARFQVGLFTPAGGPAAAEPPARLEAAARAVAARL
jgi:hypothetical protein